MNNSLDYLVSHPTSFSPGFTVGDVRVWILFYNGPAPLGVTGAWFDADLWNDSNTWLD